ncbi:hypothetical protein F5Y03DRAFT_388836 [Xylaria venustula]|nr:hypothetical protein F5Y03DRAFT_388836 [Xylaria venustula]
MQALLEPRKEPIRVPLHELRRTLDDLERQRAEEKNRRRQEPFHQTVTESLTSRETVLAREPIEIPRDDARRMLDDLKRRRAQGQARQRQEAPRQNTVIVPEDELARTIAAITQQRADERLRARAARLRAQEETDKLDRQRAKKEARTQSPATPEQTSRAPKILPPPRRPRDQPPLPRRTIPHPPPPRKRLREQELGGLLTPPPTIPNRPPKRPRPLHETAQLQRRYLESILQYREACFRDKYEASLMRSWCKEVLFALQALDAFIAAGYKRDDAETVVCRECRTGLENGKLPKACLVNNMLLSATSQNLRLITRPRRASDFVATVFPHPLVETIENIYVFWSGLTKPSPADHVTINQGEIDDWQLVEGFSVFTFIMDRMQREEPSVVEKTQTDHIVPDTDRGLEENRFASIEKLLTSAQTSSTNDPCFLDDTLSIEQQHLLSSNDTDHNGEVAYKMLASGMFSLDGPAAFEEADKLQDADDVEPCAMRLQTTGEQPVIRVERGADFADTLHEDFFPRTFPKLFPWGRGGPKALGEPKSSQQDAPEFAQRHFNHSLNYWASRLLMRRKIQALDIWTGTLAIWFTINLNDINNPVKMRLSIYRLHDYDTAKKLLVDLQGRFHLHRLLWLDGNIQLLFLIDDMANPGQEEYRSRVVWYLNSVFHECLDENAGKAEMMYNTEALFTAFDNESNYIAYCCQVHSHTYTCIKYFLKGLAEQDADNYRRTACRFKAPWKIVEKTGFTEDGLLNIRRNHPLVNRYNKAMAIGLCYNHNILIILTRIKGLAMVFYITNYATKLDTPM